MKKTCKVKLMKIYNLDSWRTEHSTALRTVTAYRMYLLRAYLNSNDIAGAGLSAQREVGRPQWQVLPHQSDLRVGRAWSGRGPWTEAAQAGPQQDLGPAEQPADPAEGREGGGGQDEEETSRLVWRLPVWAGRPAGDHVLCGGRGRGRPQSAGPHTSHAHARRGGAQREVCRASGEYQGLHLHDKRQLMLILSYASVCLRESRVGRSDIL